MDRLRPRPAAVRIIRDGCFTIATPLPTGNARRQTSAPCACMPSHGRAGRKAPTPAAPDPVQLTRINKVFMLDEHDLPGVSILKWEGPATIRAGGDPVEVTIR